MTFNATVREVGRRLFGSPSYDRLARSIAASRADLERELSDMRGDRREVTIESWASSATTLLDKAEDNLRKWQIELGFDAALAGQRAVLSNPHNLDRIDRIAVSLNRESDKITGWRAKAIHDLLQEYIRCDEGQNKTEDPMRIIDAVALRDDYFQNVWLKIQLRRRHMLSLSIIIWLSIIICLVFSYLKILPNFLDNQPLITAVVLFGVLGATLSVAQGLISGQVDARIPFQQISSFVVWMRPGVGAAAALAVPVILEANKSLNILGIGAPSDSMVVTLSFAAGYGERFILGAVGRLSGSLAEAKSS
jgi:uncharacterized membrane protein